MKRVKLWLMVLATAAVYPVPSESTHVSEGQARASFPLSSSLLKPKSSPAVPLRSPLVNPGKFSRINFLACIV